jgi:hypothetical protein
MSLTHAGNQPEIVVAELGVHIDQYDIVVTVAAIRCNRATMERIVAPPILPARSAMLSVMLKIWAAYSSNSRW